MAPIIQTSEAKIAFSYIEKVIRFPKTKDERTDYFR